MARPTVALRPGRTEKPAGSEGLRGPGRPPLRPWFPTHGPGSGDGYSGPPPTALLGRGLEKRGAEGGRAGSEQLPPVNQTALRPRPALDPFQSESKIAVFTASAASRALNKTNRCDSRASTSVRRGRARQGGAGRWAPGAGEPRRRGRSQQVLKDGFTQHSGSRGSKFCPGPCFCPLP